MSAEHVSTLVNALNETESIADMIWVFEHFDINYLNGLRKIICHVIEDKCREKDLKKLIEVIENERTKIS